MVFHMKTTLIIDDIVMARLREEAARRKKTISELVEAGIRLLLTESAEGETGPPKQKPLPSFKGGRPLVDVSDRDALYRAMEGR